MLPPEISTRWPDPEDDPEEIAQARWEAGWERRQAEYDWIDPYGDT